MSQIITSQDQINNVFQVIDRVTIVPFQDGSLTKIKVADSITQGVTQSTNQLATLIPQVTENTQKISEHQLQIEEIKTQQETQNTKITQLETKQSQQEGQIYTINTTLTEQASSINYLQGKTDSLQNQQNQANLRIEQLELDAETFNTEININKTNINNTQQQVTGLNLQQVQTQTQLTNLQNSFNTDHTQLSQNTTDITNINTQQTSTQTQLTNLQNSFNTDHVQLSQNTIDITDLRTRDVNWNQLINIPSSLANAIFNNFTYLVFNPIQNIIFDSKYKIDWDNVINKPSTSGGGSTPTTVLLSAIQNNLAVDYFGQPIQTTDPRNNQYLIIFSAETSGSTYLNNSLRCINFNGLLPILLNGSTDLITGSMMQQGTITGREIGMLAVMTDNIATQAVIEQKIADNAVTVNKILNATITGAKIAATTITGSNIASTTITGDKIADSTILSTKIADSAITTAKLGSAIVTQAKMASASVGTAQLIDSNVTLAKMAANSVSTSQLVDGSVTAAKLASGAISIQAQSVGYVQQSPDLRVFSLISKYQAYVYQSSQRTTMRVSTSPLGQTSYQEYYTSSNTVGSYVRTYNGPSNYLIPTGVLVYEYTDTSTNALPTPANNYCQFDSTKEIYGNSNSNGGCYGLHYYNSQYPRTCFSGWAQGVHTIISGGGGGTSGLAIWCSATNTGTAIGAILSTGQYVQLSNADFKDNIRVKTNYQEQLDKLMKVDIITYSLAKLAGNQLEEYRQKLKEEKDEEKIKEIKLNIETLECEAAKTSQGFSYQQLEELGFYYALADYQIMDDQYLNSKQINKEKIKKKIIPNQKKMVSYIDMIPYIIMGMKAQNQTIEKQKEKIQNLEQRLQVLEQQFNQFNSLFISQ